MHSARQFREHSGRLPPECQLHGGKRKAFFSVLFSVAFPAQGTVGSHSRHTINSSWICDEVGFRGNPGRYFLFILQMRKLSRPDWVIDPMILAPSPVHKKYIKIKYVLLFSFSSFNWSIFALQCCVSFRCIAKWFSCMYIFSSSFPLQVIIKLWV